MRSSKTRLPSRPSSSTAAMSTPRRAFAVSVLRRSLATCLRTWPSGHPEVGRAHLHLGRALALAGVADEAIGELELGLEICTTEPKDEVAVATRLLNELRSSQAGADRNSAR